MFFAEGGRLRWFAPAIPSTFDLAEAARLKPDLLALVEDSALEARCALVDPLEAAYLREERAGVLEHEAGLCRVEAEIRAGLEMAQRMGGCVNNQTGDVKSSVFKGCEQAQEVSGPGCFHCRRPREGAGAGFGHVGSKHLFCDFDGTLLEANVWGTRPFRCGGGASGIHEQGGRWKHGGRGTHACRASACPTGRVRKPLKARPASGAGKAFRAIHALCLEGAEPREATLETLANIKNPPVVLARQANITTGPQQVNNG